jgi:DtxR family Mn-dependent transcriptional regulator
MEETCKPCENEELEEMLELIWTTLEVHHNFPAVGSRLPIDVLGEGERVDRLVAEGYVRRQGEDLILSEEGFRRAKEIIRSHRLAERLLHDVLNLHSEEMERSACRYEHMLGTEAADSICILLGHPRSCPHGKYIPPGDCCESGETMLRPLVVPLTELDPGEMATVAYIGTRDNARLSYLTSLGVMTGRPIQLVQKRPSHIVKIEEATVAFDEAIAREIFVRPVHRKRQAARGSRFRFGWQHEHR